MSNKPTSNAWYYHKINRRNVIGKKVLDGEHEQQWIRSSKKAPAGK